MEETKKCSRCDEPKPVDEFNWSNKAKGLKQHECRVCHRARNVVHYSENKSTYAANRDRRRAEGKRNTAEERRVASRNLPDGIVRQILARSSKVKPKDVPDFTLEPKRMIIIKQKEKQMSDIKEESPFDILKTEGEIPLTPTVEVAPVPIVYAQGNTPLDNAAADCERVRRMLFEDTIDPKKAENILRAAVAQSVIANTQMTHDEKEKAGKLGRQIPAFTVPAQITETSNANV